MLMLLLPGIVVLVAWAVITALDILDEGGLFWDFEDWMIGTIGPLVIAAGLTLLVGIPLSATTTGCGPNYSRGTQDGFLTSVQRVGVVWKTTECAIQVGVGRQSAIQEEWGFAVRDADVIRSLSELRGHKVRVVYREWFIQPWRYGKSNREALAVEDLDETGHE